MKRLILILLVTLPLLARAQNASWKFFDRYAEAEGFTSVRLERKMMRMMSREAAEKGDEGLAKLLAGIEYIRIVALGTGDGERFVADAEELAAKRAEKKKKRSVTVEENGQTVTKEVSLADANKLRLELARKREAELHKDERTTPLNKEQ